MAKKKQHRGSATDLGLPTPEKIRRREHEKALLALQVELVKMQRGVRDQLPTEGEIVFFDRSWYNRAGVERVMGFASAEQVGGFVRQVVPLESFLVNDADARVAHAR